MHQIRFIISPEIGAITMNIETLVTILVISAIAASISRIFGGWTLAGLLASFLFACLGAVGGWVVQHQLGLPELYSISFPSQGVLVPVVWPGLAALVAAMVASFLWRPGRPQRRTRTRR
jgi:hypothetical protein